MHTFSRLARVIALAVIAAGLWTGSAAAANPAQETVRPFSETNSAWIVTAQIISPSHGTAVSGDTLTVRGRAHVDDYDTPATVTSYSYDDVTGHHDLTDQECRTTTAAPRRFCVWLAALELRVNGGPPVRAAFNSVGDFAATVTGLRDGTNTITASAVWESREDTPFGDFEGPSGAVTAQVSVVRGIPTQIEAEPVLLRVYSMTASTPVPDLVARLWAPSLPKGEIAGQSVEFIVDGRVIGSAATDVHGVARLRNTVLSGVRGLGYTARFAGTGLYRPSSDDAALVRIYTVEAP